MISLQIAKATFTRIEYQYICKYFVTGQRIASDLRECQISCLITQQP